MSIQSDLKWLRENVVTKNDLHKFKKQVYKRFNKLDKKFVDLFDYLDKDVMTTKSKVSSIEKILQIAAN